MTAAAPTGGQYRLRHAGPDGVVEAVVTEVAAGIRQLTVAGFDLTEPFPVSEAPAGANGIVLVPWPNRVAGGAWELDGKRQQLDVSEPKFGNASHGLLRFSPYRLVAQTESGVEQTATIHPQHGWPFTLETRVHHELVDDGIRITHTVTNRSGVRAPFAVGSHPYLRAGDTPAEDLVVTLDAATAFTVDERKIPNGTQSVDGTDLDLRQGRRAGDSDLDTAYTDVTPDDEGIRRTTIHGPEGDGVQLWQDPSFPYVQVFTSREFPRSEGEGKGLAVAVEPMTAPADALNSGEGLRWLEPDDSWTGSWGIRRVWS
ncbi:aldose 1-epimerase family protein [Curtobacterium sp. MCLR17_007]|uniref:aldose 1-epimerase family protein n=1 Tax=Curtobacterium sp. MCLR17_007 TaxID=2175648 RepID=UPI000DA9308A|nr:aldose 1-epimerase family protein [Curtobacterium sp. MCLR17_007]WIB59874.1 aldose 1-epimerase family protein [Curtobacterium sp. MCLR17_007]